MFGVVVLLLPRRPIVPVDLRTDACVSELQRVQKALAEESASQFAKRFDLVTGTSDVADACFRTAASEVNLTTCNASGPVSWSLPVTGGSASATGSGAGSSSGDTSGSGTSTFICQECGKHCSAYCKLQQHKVTCCVELERADPNVPSLSSIAENRIRGDTRSSLLRQLTDMRIDRHFGNTVIESVKSFTVAALDSVKTALNARLSQMELGGSLSSTVDAVFNVFEGIRSERQEARARESLLPIVQPEQRCIGIETEEMQVDGRTVKQTHNAYIWEIPFAKALAKLLQNDASAVAAVLHSAKRWKASLEERGASVSRKSKKVCGATRTFSDIEDGEAFFPFLSAVQRDTADWENSTPIALMLYYDGLEVNNGLGHARGTHKMGCFYWALVNLEPERRLQLSNIHLHAVCLEKHVSQFGPEIVLSGPNPEIMSGYNFDASDSSSWGFSMNQLMNGELTVTVPNAESKAGEMKLHLCGGTCLVSADTPAACLLCGFKTTHGPMTKSICRHCHCLQHHPTDPALHGPYRYATHAHTAHVCPCLSHRIV